MGLQGQVSDCSTESFFVLTVAIVASFVSYLRSLTFMALRYLNLSRFDPDADEGMFGFGSGFTGLAALAEQLNLNRVLSHAYGGDCDKTTPSQCVVCLSKLKEGEQVRKLPCRHVFHKGCFDGWLDQLNFSCPICRSPLASPEQRVEVVERRVGRDLLTFFSFR